MIDDLPGGPPDARTRVEGGLGAASGAVERPPAPPSVPTTDPATGEPVVPDALTVLRAGPMATVQDLGRAGHRARGVPTGGAFDVPAHEVANALVGNGPDAATVELTLFGGTFRAGASLAVALAGAPMPARRRRPGAADRRFEPPVAFELRDGDELDIGGAPAGVRAYLAVRGGWRSPLVLGSRSSEEPLRDGDTLPALPSSSPVRRLGEALVEPLDRDAPIRLIAGPDASLLLDRDWHRHRFAVAPASDRMGLRLEGPEVAVAAPPDRLSAPVAPGALQIAGGRPIVLGVSCGTMGGYPHVAHVASVDLPRLAQARPGATIRFLPVSPAEARRLDRLDRRRRRSLRLRIAALAGEGGR